MQGFRRQVYGDVNLEDDVAIDDDQELVRQLTWNSLAGVEAGGYRLSSQAFKSNKPKGMSVNFASCMVIQGHQKAACISPIKGRIGAASIRARDARQVADGIAWTPKPADDFGPENKCHADIIGSFQDSKSKEFARRATILDLDEGIILHHHWR